MKMYENVSSTRTFLMVRMDSNGAYPSFGGVPTVEPAAIFKANIPDYEDIIAVDPS